MKTNHKIIFDNSQSMSMIPPSTVHLMLTSPPYPMIAMWDQMFFEHNPKIKFFLDQNQPNMAFELMHRELDKVWDETYRILIDGGIACINIGDAVRTINKNFQLYPNHARILTHCLNIGFQQLPGILWRKQTNSPNKFMGSGMLPPGAYPTLEHEHILILRKGAKREFNKDFEKLNRKKSAFFWEERNTWFSDIWHDLKGAKQKVNDKKIRDRSAAYPFEFAYRLISMFSVKGDTVLDPYLGTGTTTIASMVSERNSIGIEIDPNFESTIINYISTTKDISNAYREKRINQHMEFINKRINEKGSLKHKNVTYNFPVMTSQEKDIEINVIFFIEKVNNKEYNVYYS